MKRFKKLILIMVIVSMSLFSVNVKKSHAFLIIGYAVVQTGIWVYGAYIVGGAVAYAVISKGVDKLDKIYEEDKDMGKYVDFILRNPENWYNRHSELDVVLDELEERFIDIAEAFRDDYWNWKKENPNSDDEDFELWEKYPELFQLMINESMSAKRIFKEGVENGNQMHSAQ